MTVVKDWIADASVEIASISLLSEDGVRQVILKHCPFKSDVAYVELGVAYMPVPRCETCTEFLHAEHHSLNEGYCDAIAAHVTRDFGCVQWEEKIK